MGALNAGIELSWRFSYCDFSANAMWLIIIVLFTRIVNQLVLWSKSLLPVLISSAIRLSVTCLAKRWAWNEALFA